MLPSEVESLSVGLHSLGFFYCGVRSGSWRLLFAGLSFLKSNLVWLRRVSMKSLTNREKAAMITWLLILIPVAYIAFLGALLSGPLAPIWFVWLYVLMRFLAKRSGLW